MKKKQTWREKYKGEKQSHTDMDKEYLLSQATVYFLGSALIAQSVEPSIKFGFLYPVFMYLHGGRYIISSVILLLSMFLWYTVIVSKPKSIEPLAMEILRRGYFIPLLFFWLDLLNVTINLLHANIEASFILVFYLCGLILLMTGILWYPIQQLRRKAAKRN